MTAHETAHAHAEPPAGKGDLTCRVHCSGVAPGRPPKAPGGTGRLVALGLHGRSGTVVIDLGTGEVRSTYRPRPAHGAAAEAAHALVAARATCSLRVLSHGSWESLRVHSAGLGRTRRDPWGPGGTGRAPPERPQHRRRIEPDAVTE